MSSSRQVNLKYLKDISFFIRDVYSHTVNLQQSLLGEVKLGTLKVGKNVVEFDRNDTSSLVLDSNKKLTNQTNITVDKDKSKTSKDDLTRTSVSDETNQTVEKHVIKVCDKLLFEQLNDRISENPLMEIEVLERLCTGNTCYPYFVKLINAFEDHSSYCTILEYIPSGDLCNFVQLHGAFEYERARRYSKQITLAVDYLHKHGYCHLDLSLENILLDERTDTIKLCDFGLCRKMSPNKKPFEALSTRPGKKSYIAPEVYNYLSFHGDKADIFSLGVIYFILLTGFPPFHKPCESDPCFRNVYERDVGVLLEKWQLTHVVPQECVDLLNKIFVSEAKRISMRELLSHPYWMGVQSETCIDLNISKLEIEEEIEQTQSTRSDEQLSPEILSDSNISGNNTIDGSDLELTQSVTRSSGELSEMKYADERPNEDYDSSRHLEVHYSRRGDTIQQHNENRGIRKRVLSHGSGHVDADTAVENLIDIEFGIWDLGVQSDNE